MEYKTANELKPKEFIIDPESEEIYQIISVKPGNKPRLIFRDLKLDKVSERIVSSKKQFLLAEAEDLTYQLNYYSENNLYVMDYNTYEELIFDGTSLGSQLEKLKADFDSGKGIEVIIERLGTQTTLKNYKTSVEQNVSSESNESITEKDKMISEPIDSAKKEIRKRPQKPVKIIEKEVKKSEIKLEESEKKSKIFTFKDFKGLGEKTASILTTDYGIKTLQDLISADIEKLKKIPRVSDKKIIDWKKQAKELLK